MTMARPTIAELEAILNSENPGRVSINPDGSVTVVGAIDDVAAERKRQIEVEGWTAEHDDYHPPGELAQAGACYALVNSEALFTPFASSQAPEPRPADAPREDAFHVGCTRVEQARDHRPADFRGLESRRSHDDIRRGLTAHRELLLDRDVGAHGAQCVDDARARHVRADAALEWLTYRFRPRHPRL